MGRFCLSFAWTKSGGNCEAPVVASEAASNGSFIEGNTNWASKQRVNIKSSGGESEPESLDKETSEATGSAQPADSLAEYKVLKASLMRKDAYDQNLVIFSR